MKVGFVTVNLPGHDGDEANMELQKDTAKLGADAIINLDLTLASDCPAAKGIALKYKK